MIISSSSLDRNSDFYDPGKWRAKVVVGDLNKRTCYPPIYPDLDAGSPAHWRQLPSAWNVSHLSPWHEVQYRKIIINLCWKSLLMRERALRPSGDSCRAKSCLLDGHSSSHSCAWSIRSHTRIWSISLFLLFIFKLFLSAVCTLLTARWSSNPPPPPHPSLSLSLLHFLSLSLSSLDNLGLFFSPLPFVFFFSFHLKFRYLRWVVFHFNVGYKLKPCLTSRSASCWVARQQRGSGLCDLICGTRFIIFFFFFAAQESQG